jgi:hypothetical protein
MYEPTSEWYELEKNTPPDELILVKNSSNKIRVACPTYFPFDDNMMPQVNAWDGGWMIESVSFDDSFYAEEITHWARFNYNQKKSKLPQ